MKPKLHHDSMILTVLLINKKRISPIFFSLPLRKDAEYATLSARHISVVV